jgi:hypothetical protein
MFMVIGIILIVISTLGILYGFSEESNWIKILGILGVIVGIIFIGAYFFTAEGARTVKSWTSNTGGGLERTVDVYDKDGKLIEEYQGKIDVQDTQYGNKVLFDLNGKRTIIYNATVIVQEK